MRDRIGEKSGMLTVVGLIGPCHRDYLWRCSCECGGWRDLPGNKIKRTRSCGCLGWPVKHGLSKRPEYYVWKAMIGRCTNPDHPQFKWYGGRGISVCERWMDVEKFFEDMLPRPDGPRMSIDRIDNDGDYEPGNCQWITQSENSRKAANTRWHG
jgi:hypothetical protein